MPSLPLDSEKVRKDAYRAPRLTVYGDVLTLTAAGTGTVTETGTSPSCQTNVNRRVC